MLSKVYQTLASRKLAVVLFAFVCLTSLPGTLMEKRDGFSMLLLRISLGMLWLNLLLCTLKNLKVLSKPVIVLHFGSMLTLAGCLISSLGFTATVNIYEGASIKEVYRWDIRKDASLGVDIMVKKINREYYPIPVKIGVLDNGDKAGLFELRTGESFNIGRYRVRVDAIDFPSEEVRMSVFEQGRFLCNVKTSEDNGLPRNFPYRFVLVAFKDPVVKRIWVDLALARGKDVVAEGTSEVNAPLKWEGLDFYNTQTAVDDHGLPYAGIQITKDPGKPYVFFGFGLMGLGSIAYLARKIYGYE